MSKIKRKKKFYFSIVATVLLFVVVGVLVVLSLLKHTIPVRTESEEVVVKRLFFCDGGRAFDRRRVGNVQA